MDVFNLLFHHHAWSISHLYCIFLDRELWPGFGSFYSSSCFHSAQPERIDQDNAWRPDFVLKSCNQNSSHFNPHPHPVVSQWDNNVFQWTFTKANVIFPTFLMKTERLESTFLIFRGCSFPLCTSKATAHSVWGCGIIDPSAQQARAVCLPSEYVS